MMLITYEREKLINSIIFFVTNTKKCGKVKLFKLLYFLDFEHYKSSGRSVTGLDYNAWKMGPVPVSLYEEIDSPEPDMAAALRFEERPIRQGEQKMLVITPARQFSDSHFTKREMRLLNDLATEYRDADADNMIEATHLENKPWHKVYVQQNQKQAIIPYDLAVRPDEHELVRRIANERRETLHTLQ
ncbi:Panacea domain-containing protein [Mongoliimonas terrestris]|uniref:Panacea domain-containing protein n=1 Tax=Mongoliimonas terrestris TaxID=1709001 RepID=UPI001FD8847B|nr:Panacea domain-containing protein [Mongoliimonas terrestris]